MSPQFVRNGLKFIRGLAVKPLHKYTPVGQRTHERVDQKLHYSFGCKQEADSHVLGLQKLPVVLTVARVRDAGTPVGDWGNRWVTEVILGHSVGGGLGVGHVIIEREDGREGGVVHGRRRQRGEGGGGGKLMLHGIQEGRDDGNWRAGERWWSIKCGNAGNVVNSEIQYMW